MIQAPLGGGAGRGSTAEERADWKGRGARSEGPSERAEPRVRGSGVLGAAVPGGVAGEQREGTLGPRGATRTPG